MFHPELMKALLRESVLQLESRPHAGFPGLRERYYYRGNFILLEALTPKAVAWNVARLHRKGEHEHADRLSEFAEVAAKGIRSRSGGERVSLLTARSPLAFISARSSPARRSARQALH
jgi:hypothetical protein